MQLQPRCISIVCPPYVSTPTVNYGGTENVIWILAGALRLLGFRIILLVPNRVNDAPTGIEYVQLRSLPILDVGDWGNHQAAIDYYTAAERWLRENREGIWRVIYHISGPFDGLVAHMANRLWQDGIKGVVEIHSLPGRIIGDCRRHWPDAPAELTNWGKLRFPVVSPSRFAGYFATSELHLSEGQVRIIPHPIPDEEFVPTPPASPPYLAWLGRFNAFKLRGKEASQKGAEHVVEVASRLQVHAILAGVIQDEVQQRLFNQNIRPHVQILELDWNQPVAAQLPPEPASIFIGQITAEQREILFSGAACILTPSLGGEVFGMPPIEGYKYGVPAVGYGSDGVADAIIEGKTGYLVPVLDIDGLTNATRAALRMKRSEVLTNARKNFGARELAKRWVKVLEVL